MKFFYNRNPQYNPDFFLPDPDYFTSLKSDEIQTCCKKLFFDAFACTCQKGKFTVLIQRKINRFISFTITYLQNTNFSRIFCPQFVWWCEKNAFQFILKRCLYICFGQGEEESEDEEGDLWAALGGAASAAP